MNTQTAQTVLSAAPFATINHKTLPSATQDTSKVDAKTKASAQDFEAVFISEMLSHMFEGIKPDPMFGGGSGEKMFQGMMVQEYGKMMAKGQGIGISQQLQTVMMQMQEQQHTTKG
ncbi:MAG: rod-binding protein [Micavibrio sp.]|nr:rod-binding protein [Micavibrio sp.]